MYLGWVPCPDTPQPTNRWPAAEEATARLTLLDLSPALVDEKKDEWIRFYYCFVRKHINPALKSCHWADKYVLELCVMSPTVVGSSLGKVKERGEKCTGFITHWGNPLIIHTGTRMSAYVRAHLCVCMCVYVHPRMFLLTLIDKAKRWACRWIEQPLTGIIMMGINHLWHRFVSSIYSDTCGGSDSLRAIRVN